MKFCVIPPLSAPDLMREGDMIFVLAQHYLKDKSYRSYVKELKSEGFFIILDNGMGDYETVSPVELLEATKDLMPNEIIPLDTIYDADVTLSDLAKFIYMMKEEDLVDKVNVFAVPQGATKEDWLFCYKKMLSNPLVKTIGLSKIGVPYAWGLEVNDQNVMEGRHACYDELMKQNLISKPIHCLGAGDPREFLKYATNPMMRSTDSCFSVWAGMNDISWRDGNFERVKTPRDYFQLDVSVESRETILSNISFLEEMTKSIKRNGEEII